MFGDEDALIQIDMSEYMEKHNVSPADRRPAGLRRLRGGRPAHREDPPPAVRVVLLDEIEKAHPDVYNMLLQIMEEGRLTDSFGRNVDFKNTIIIMTTNIGAEATSTPTSVRLRPRPRRRRDRYEKMKERLKVAIEKYFRPEFLNRLDDVIVFHSLTKDEPQADHRHRAGEGPQPAGRPRAWSWS